MTARAPTRILFTGYAPVHFLCFRPLYQRLCRMPGVEVFVSGGLRTKTENDGTLHDEQAMYGPLGVPAGRVLSVQQIQSLDFDVLFAANTTLIMPRSVGTRVQLFHGISFRNKSIRPENMGCDYYFLIGPYMRRKFTQAELLEENDPRAVCTGFPKTDPLLGGELDRAKLRRHYGFDAERPVLLYAPTGQKYNSLEIMGEDVIARLVECGKYNLLIKLHDHPKGGVSDWHARLARFEGTNCRLARELDVVPMLHLADLLFTDASSVSNEYALLDRPIVFLDVPKLLARAAESEDSMLDLQTWGRKVGTIVEQPEDVLNAVEENLANPGAASAIRRAMVKDLFFNPGTATNAAMAWLQDHVLSGAQVRLAAG